MKAYKISEKAHIDQELEANPLYISSLKHTSPLHYHDFYEFFLITKGRCRHLVNGQTQHLSEGALVFIRPGDRHCYAQDGDGDCEFINIACARRAINAAFEYLGGEAFSGMFLRPPLPPCARLSHAEVEALIEGCERLRTLSVIDKPRARSCLRRMLVELLTQYFTPPSGETARMPLWLTSLLSQMHRRENFTAGTSRLFELSGRSAGHVNRTFRRFLGVTPTAYVNNLKLDFARSMLTVSQLNVVDIAMEAGFENLSHFYHLFKNRFGQTPSGLRKSLNAR